MPTGLYITVPFCRSKCSYCNFASDVFSGSVFERYVDRVCCDIENTIVTAEQMGGDIDLDADSVYLGGGTPTLLDIKQFERLFAAVAQNFRLRADAEVTVECAPGTLSPAMLEAFQRCGVNRVSLGVQSFVDREAASVGRLHTEKIVAGDIASLRRAGIVNLNVDLIAGLPHQTAQSWEVSLREAVACGAPHVSIYMLEVDEDSRLGRELLAGGTKYHAHSVPDEDLTADLYTTACAYLEAAGIHQYEISNFARPQYRSRHNLKYWTRQPYLGFGVDAHSMLRAAPRRGLPGEVAQDAVRFATSDSLEAFLRRSPLSRTAISLHTALEETWFLGLRLTRGIDLTEVAAGFGADAVGGFYAAITELIACGLMERETDTIRLTPRGRLLSNEVFERFISCAVVAC